MGKKERTDHDQIFKTLFKEFFKEFMDGFLPKIAEKLDFQSVEFLEKETFSDLNKGQKKLMDLVVKVRTVFGEEEFILLHTEFESSRPKKDFPERMFKYLCQLYIRHGKPVIPIVIFSDDAKWSKPVSDTFLIKFNDIEYVHFFYHQFKLKHLNWKSYINSNNPLIYALMAKMDYNKKDIVRLKTDFLRLVLKSEKNEARRQVLVEFIENYVILKGDELEKFTAIVESRQELKEIKKMVTVYEERGIQKGLQKGSITTAQSDVIEVLEVKFGNVPYPIKEKILYCDDLQKLKQALRTAILLDDINKFKI